MYLPVEIKVTEAEFNGEFSAVVTASEPATGKSFSRVTIVSTSDRMVFAKDAATEFGYTDDGIIQSIASEVERVAEVASKRPEIQDAYHAWLGKDIDANPDKYKTFDGFWDELNEDRRNNPDKYKYYDQQNSPSASKRITPIPLDSPRPPEFPEGVFRGWYGDMVDAIAEATETHRELAATFVLAALATAVQGKARITIQHDYIEPLNLWLLCGLSSGNRKTAAMVKAVSPLADWESAKRAEIEPLAEIAKSQQKTIDARVAKLRTEASKAKPEDFKRLTDEIAEYEANPIQIPHADQLFSQDVTPEHTGTMLSENSERLSLLSDEGGLFDLMAGRYNGNVPNLDVYLQSHAGAFVRVNRGSRQQSCSSIPH